MYGLDHGGSAFGESEALFGRVLADAPSLRDGMVIATKGGIVPGVPYDSSAAHLVGRLRRVAGAAARSTRIDLYQIHRHDWLAHPEETAGALVRLREAGKIREVGVSNFTPGADRRAPALPAVPDRHAAAGVLVLESRAARATVCSTSACASA